MSAAPRIPWTSETIRDAHWLRRMGYSNASIGLAIGIEQHRVTNLLGLQTLDAPAFSLAHIVTKPSQNCVDSEPLGNPLPTYPAGDPACS